MLNKGAVVIQEKQDTIYSCIIQQLEKLKDMPQIHGNASSSILQLGTHLTLN